MEALNEHPVLTASVTLGTGTRLADILGAKVKWQPPGSDNAVLFSGILTNVYRDRSGTVAVAHGQSVLRDLVRRTRSFSGPVVGASTFELPGMEVLLQGVAGATELSCPVHHLLQMEETD
ncbi:MAG TPA: hypothetical protein VFF73_28875, partial [Planctomycetota bacterium]|nr:hypothetical protein [Planctomycetota bacterium]